MLPPNRRHDSFLGADDNRPTRQLADLGTRVVEVERPGAGDFAHSYGGTVTGAASHFVWLSRFEDGDKIGQKSMLVLTPITLGIVTVCMSLLPAYEAIGVRAPTLSVALRLVLGFGVGGEWGAAVLMAAEQEQRRNWTASGGSA